jgi:hypothetical protein
MQASDSGIKRKLLLEITFSRLINGDEQFNARTFRKNPLKRGSNNDVPNDKSNVCMLFGKPPK